MSAIMNALGLGHKDAAHHDESVAREAGKTHTATVENTANKGAATTTTTTTTTNNNTTAHGAHGVHGSSVASASDINTTAPYGSSTATSTARTGAAYTNTTGAAPIATQQQQAYTERSGLSSDAAMTRSEEQLRVAKATVETGKAELNKTVEHVHVEQAVPVQRERVVIEREPITAANIGNALNGPTISEAHFETTLHEDRVAATKETVPIERIRLAKQVETSVESVGADLRKEHIDFTQTKLNDKVDMTSSNLHGNKVDTSANMHNTNTTATYGLTNTNTTRSAY